MQETEKDLGTLSQEPGLEVCGEGVGEWGPFLLQYLINSWQHMRQMLLLFLFYRWGN